MSKSGKKTKNADVLSENSAGTSNDAGAFVEVIDASNEDRNVTMIVEKNLAKKVHCIILNPHELETGLVSEHIFEGNGGRIGSDPKSNPKNDWLLKDHAGSIYAVHCLIEPYDHFFCIKPISGNTYVNSTDLILTNGKPAMLTTNDVITIGPYKIRVNIVDSDAVLDSPRYQKRDLGAFFSEEMEDAQLIPNNNTYNQGNQNSKVDPLLMLNEHNSAQEHALTHKDPYTQNIWDEQNSMHSDFQYNLDAAMNNSSRASNGVHISEGLDASLNALKNAAYPNYNAETYSDHLATGPMLRGLGVSLSLSDHSGEMQYVAQEMGESLKEAVQGLLKLHAQVNNSRYGLMNKNFQPIEDNPLRLGLPYEETIRLMYDAEVSPVHLSPPAAINESLEMIYNHQEAMHEAISEALTQVLHAFSPEALTRRFNYYRLARKVPESDRETWAWKMYKSYYSELVSNRQTGFQKLFWEIFDQVYDKKMRELQIKNSMADPFNLLSKND